MENDEAIEVIRSEKACVEHQAFCDHDCGHCGLAMTDSEILEAYDMAIDALEYRIPKKMKFDWWTTAGDADYTLICPTCGQEPECDDFCKELPFCAKCGQALDWRWKE